MEKAVKLFATAFKQTRPGEIEANVEKYFSERIDISALSILANQGNAQAQFFLGMFYADGNRVEQDKDMALRWYNESAKQNEPMALFMVGYYIANGIGIKKDLFRATKIIKQAAELGLYKAQLYYNGVLLEMIISEAPYLLAKVLDNKWADKFLDGEVFMRTLACFGDIGKRDGSTNNTFRGDTLEAYVESFGDGYNHYGYMTKDGKIVKDGQVGVISALIQQEKVYCLYSLEYDEIEKRYVKPDSRLRDFGDTAVIITDTEEFLRRVSSALHKKYEDSFWWSYKRVSYNIDVLQGLKYSEFCKSPFYSWQNEFRIVLDLSDGRFSPDVLNNASDFAKLTFPGKIKEDTNPDSIAESLVVKIGDIRDICIKMPVSELLNLEHNVFIEGLLIPNRLETLENKREPRPTFCKGVMLSPVDEDKYCIRITKDWLYHAVL
jgi:hypothetical protein